MTKSMERKLIVGLDVGTSKIAVVVGELLPDGELNIIGLGQSASRGMDKGGVNDLESVVKAVQRAKQEAEMMADMKISSVYLSISGKHISSQDEIGMVAISEDEVTQDDVDNVIYTARSVRIRDEHRILHVIPQEYAIDYQERIKNPVGLSGVRMKAKVHLITCHNDMAKNIVKCAERCELQVDKLIFSALASSYAVVTDDEKELGVCVVDIGGGTIDIAVFYDGSLRHTSVFSYAGNAVTSDIAYAFGTPPADAEEIKVNFGCAHAKLLQRDDTIEVASVGGRPSRTLQRQTLAEVIEPRYSELFGMVEAELKTILESLKLDKLAAGIVLTGGAAQIEGLVECAESVFNSQVRIGIPLNINGLTEYVNTPVYSTAVGLLQFGKEHQFEPTTDVVVERNNCNQLLKRIMSWFKGGF
ncbi:MULTISPECIES: cell division protein FtsA [unclassified Moritella]|uniref:cell division protein FtsA n=1 Tax=unclassified Moritella TaxID=2637987 RepID=UPI001BA443F3|nr:MULTISPECIES: cell division protein FtsA [unclassified Moritella]QUM83261.1 cell division protein FtsA [Moritella sp. 28]QUM87563.1 cell division protein FtsA [Moritella sp. 36]